MANPIIQAVYDLQDKVTAKLKTIADGFRSNAAAGDKLADNAERNAKRMSDGYGKTADGIGKLKGALAALAGFVALDKIKDGLLAVVDAGEKIDDIGKQFATAFGGLDKGAEQLDRVREFAKGVPQPFEDIAQAAIKLRQLGFDPLDGTLQALVDNQNALDQSSEGLMATIDALGKANIRGGVNLKSLVALTESGVPVFDLLGKAMGVSADRVRELANEGKLTGDSIKTLITELGKLRAGAAADELGDTDSQLQKLKDTATEFLETIASSGALDVLRAELKNLNAEVEDAAKSGRLKEIAKSISDGIVATAGAVKSAVGFVVDYSGALLELGKTYIIFRGLNIATSLLESAAAIEKTAAAAKGASAAANSTAGSFGGLGAAARGIPSLIKLSVAAFGIDFVIGRVFAVKGALDELRETNAQSEEIDKDRAETLAKLAERIAAVKDQYKQYAGVAIESGEELKTQSADQLKSYGAQLQGAQKYYQALVVEARAANDQAGLKDAKAHLQEVQTEIGLVNDQLAGTAVVGAQAAQGLTVGATAIAAKLGEVADDAKAANEAVGKAFEGFNLDTQIAEVGDFALGFDAVAARGGKAGATLDATLLESLKKLSGEDLLKFQTLATFAIDSVGESGEKTSATLKATLETALDRLGVKAEATGVAITKSGQDTIASFTAVAQNAQASAKVIEAAFDAALASAKTVDEAKALGEALKAAAAQGKVGLQEMAAAGRDLDERIRTITANISPLASQFDLLGIKSQAQLVAVRDNAREAFDAIVTGARNGTAAQEDVVRAFKAYVDASRAASADSSAAAKEQVEDQLDVLAGALNLGDAFVKAGDAGKKAGADASEGFDQAKQSIDDAGGALKDFGTDAAAAAIAADRIGESAKSNAADIGGVIVLTGQQIIAQRELTAELQRSGNLQQIGLESAKFILQEIGGLIGAEAQELANRIRDLEEAAQQAEQTASRMADEANQIQDEIDQLQGNQSDIEDRRHAKRLADLKAEAELDGTLNTAAYRNLVELENKLHDLKLKNAKSEEKTNGTGGGSGAGGGLGGGNANANNNAAPAPAPSTTQPPTTQTPVPGPTRGAPSIVINVTGSLIGVGSEAQIVEQLARVIRPQLDKLDRLSR